MRDRSVGRWIFRLALAVALSAMYASAQIDAADLARNEQFVDALRDRRLSRLLELEIRRQLRDASTPVQTRAGLVRELAGLLSLRGARSVDVATREASFKEADKLTSDFLSEHPTFAGVEEWRYGASGQLLERAQLLEELARLTEDEALRAESLRWARSAVDALEAVRLSAERKLEERGGKNVAKDSGGPSLTSILTAAEYRVGFAWLAIARAEADAARRAEALARAKERLQRFASEWSIQPAVLEGFLARAEAHGLSGELDKAVALLRQLQSARTPVAYRAKADLLLARLMLESNNLEKAVSILDVPRAKRTAGAVWDLLLVEALLRRAQEMTGHAPKQAAELKSRALALLDDLRSQFGGVWGKRGDRLLAEHITLDGAAEDVSQVERIAGALRDQKKYAEALKAYRQAAELAQQEGNADVAGRLSYGEAATLVESGELEKGAEQFAQLARDQPKHFLAPRAQLAAAVAWAALEAKKPDPAISARYEAALESHLQSFPNDSATGPEVAFRIGELRERLGRPMEAVAFYRTIPADSPRFAAAEEALAGIYHDRFLTAKSNPGPPTELRKAVEDLKEILQASVEPSQPRRSTSLVRWVLARLMAAEDTLDAAAMLRTSMTDEQLSPEQRVRAGQTLLDWNIRRGDETAAKNLLAAGDLGDAKNLTRWLAGVEMESSTDRPEVQSARLAVVEVVAKQLLAQPQALSAADAFQIRLRLATAYEGRGLHADAQRLLKQLTSEQPRDPRILRLLARSLFMDGKYAESLELWTRLTQGVPRGAPQWLEAVSYSIDCQGRLGRREQAATLLTTTAGLFPELGGPVLRARFEASARELRLTLPPRGDAP